jgi:hypothetical protein
MTSLLVSDLLEILYSVLLAILLIMLMPVDFATIVPARSIVLPIIMPVLASVLNCTATIVLMAILMSLVLVRCVLTNLLAMLEPLTQMRHALLADNITVTIARMETTLMLVFAKLALRRLTVTPPEATLRRLA